MGAHWPSPRQHGAGCGGAAKAPRATPAIVAGGRELLHHSDEQLESALWSAIRALHERASTWETLARDSITNGSELVTSDYSQRAREAREQAEIARRFMLDLVRREVQ